MPNVLIIEDEPGIALGLKNEMASEGYVVEVANDGNTGYERASKGSFDVILLDIMLPGQDGYTICRKLRQAGIRTPVLMLTAKALEAEKVLGLELGADDYLTKPFGSLELRARVKALLRRSAPEAADIYTFGGVEVDFRRAGIRRAGKVLETTLLEKRLMWTFVKRRGRIMTREQLMDEVWRPDSSPTGRVIDNHIMNLRRNVNPDPQQPRYLVSVRGLGYRFDG
jgi:DNA-binding response OmpR family regulator